MTKTMNINYQHCDECGDAKFKWLEKKILKEIEETNSYGSETRAMWVRGALKSLLEGEKQ